ncbi:hypothetical protein CYG48_05840 [Neorhizobium sp. SOG26]|uniref:hypothetical protein n=1 Tax=Neorhizobium sp. SOG26 TaxID=2060726 RepID=UPI000E597C29|nr:hypothetical protein [Neorhizobium sp. SOG26]AXV15266.1 hypothetical protein CYG48_05840 [Neorhizobium sp. SOG26]
MTLETTQPQQAVRGYGLAIYSDGNADRCGFLDHSPVLVPSFAERVAGRRRLRFHEGPRLTRRGGDIFCADGNTANFVRQAVEETLQRERDDANAFRVTGASVSQRRLYKFLRVSVTKIESGAEDSRTFTLEAPSLEVQQCGQREFAEFLTALDKREIDDPDELVGLTVNRRGMLTPYWSAPLGVDRSG